MPENFTPLVEPSAPDPMATPPLVSPPPPAADAKFDRTPWIAWLKSVLVWLTISGAGSGATYFAMRPAKGGEPADAIVLPKEIRGKPHERIEIAAVTAGQQVRWHSLDRGLLVIDDLPDLVAAKRVIVVACRSGRYRMQCWSAIDNQPTAIFQTSVVVSNVPPPDPTPPDPTPPAPPVPPVPPAPPPVPPVPPPPAPVDPLTAKFQAAFDADASTSQVKRGQITQMVGLYHAMVDHSKDSTIKTTGDLLADYQATAKKLMLPSELIGIRKLVAAEVASVFGADSATLDDPMRTKATDLWTRLAKCLGDVK